MDSGSDSVADRTRVQGTGTDITYRSHGDQLRLCVITEGLNLNIDGTTAGTSTQPSEIEDNLSANVDTADRSKTGVPEASQSLRRSARNRKLSEHYDP